MRIKAYDSKYGGVTTRFWDEYVDNYRQIARDYRVTDERKLQVLHNIFSKNAKGFFIAAVVPHVVAFQQAVNQISAEYYSPVRQVQVENYPHSL